MSTHPTGLLRPTRRTILGGLLGGAATASGIALTATSGWLIVRASEQPVILTLLTAIVGRARLRHRPTVLPLPGAARVARRRPRRPRRAAHRGVRRARAAHPGPARAPVAVERAHRGRRRPDRRRRGAGAGHRAAALERARRAGRRAAHRVVRPGRRAGARRRCCVAVAGTCWLAWLLESRSRDELLEARAEVLRVSELVARQADELQAIGGEATAAGLAARRARHAAAARAAGRAAAAPSSRRPCSSPPPRRRSPPPSSSTRPSPAAPVAALLVVVPVAVGDALAPLVDTMRCAGPGPGQRGAARRPARPGAGGDRPRVSRGRRTPPTSGRQRRPRRRRRRRGPARASSSPPTDLAPRARAAGRGRRAERLGQVHPARGAGPPPRPQPGRHTVDGVDVRDLTLDDVRRHVAVVDDEPHVFAASVAANLRLAAPGRRRRASSTALDRAGLGGWLRRPARRPRHPARQRRPRGLRR